MQATLSDRQRGILDTFHKRGILTPDDCSTFMGCFTCSIEQELIDLAERGLLRQWDAQTEEDFESQPFMITPEGRAAL